jgi:uncharacterized membrane protein
MRVLVMLHVLAVIVWVGGMFFAHFFLRPVAAAQLAPPQRLPFLAAVLGRFFVAVTIAIGVIFGTGVLRFVQVGGAQLPPHWHAMAGVGTAMTVIFAIISLVFLPRLKRAVAEQRWPDGGAAMDSIRKLVLVNLILGLVTTAIAILGGVMA